jgi:hypothetical protein
MKQKLYPIILGILINFSPQVFAGGSNYKNFTVSVYARAYEVRQMGDLKWLEPIWNEMFAQVKVDKIYLETHRDLIIVDEKTIETAKKFFQSRGIKVAGGITYTVNESNRYETFCYTNPEHRKKVKEIAEYTAKHFDEIILDDFFFTNCKCELCIKAKGNLSWTQYRLNLMTKAAQELVIGPAKAVNPKVKVVIKYPNWYEHFQGLGFNLEAGPKQFDGIYTGTETRDPDRAGQHLQQYESYLIFRYFENIKPGSNGGGWVDTGGLTYLDRYAEQLWLTLFAKAPEITLFDFRQLQRTISLTDRAEWQGKQTSFDFDEMMKPFKLDDGKTVKPTTIARAAGITFEKVDLFVGKLGNPIGVKSYKPYHSTGEDFLQNYLGMVGVPMDIVPEFPTEPKMIVLTESAKSDTALVSKIKGQLMAGKNVTITSGLLRALQGKGIADIVELEYSNRNSLVKDFVVGRRGEYQAKQEIMIPQISYLTNDSWEDITSLGGGTGWPILHQARYANGSLFVLTIPDNFGDLYNIPLEVLNRIRNVLSQDIKVHIECPAKVSLFVYDNGTFIVESFQHEEVKVKIVVDKSISKLNDLLSGEELNGNTMQDSQIWGREKADETSFDIMLKPHSYRVFLTR